MTIAYDTPYSFGVERLAQSLDCSIFVEQFAVWIVGAEGVQCPFKELIRREWTVARSITYVISGRFLYRPCFWSVSSCHL
jgi:hypothetical protein